MRFDGDMHNAAFVQRDRRVYVTPLPVLPTAQFQFLAQKCVSARRNYARGPMGLAPPTYKWIAFAISNICAAINARARAGWLSSALLTQSPGY